MALSMGYNLVQEQRMKLMMTPELHQAIQVLQFSAVDLIQYIQDQVIENPVLELEGLEVGREEMNSSLLRAESLREWANYLRKNNDTGKSYSPANEENNPLDWLATKQESLIDILEHQLGEIPIDDQVRKVCLFLIGNLDEQGYLRIDFSHVCKRFTISEEKVEHCLQLIQSLDPPGIGARSLEECLRLQLLKMEEMDPVALNIVDRFLSDIAAGRYNKVAKRMGCDVSRIQKAVDRIKKLNPRPGLAYTAELPRYVYPDVIVERVGDNYTVGVNDKYMPRLSIRSDYEQMLYRMDEGARQAANFLKSRFQSAIWLMRSIEQRKHTLYRVSSAIVDQQRAFFDHGISKLKPLTLRQIAEQLDLHESTVSRATQHKYIQTPLGLFPFRFFFPSGVSTQFGGNASAKSVKRQMKQIIDEEDKRKPLSDQRIADLLHAKGVRISRRTVAKYREEMGIGSSSLRRRYDENGA